MSGDLLVVFTRYPRPGRAKTRLIPELGPAGAAQAQREMTGHSVLTARAASAVGGFSIQVRYADAAAARIRRWLGPDVDYVPQGEGDLGQRMARAFQGAFDAGRERVVLIGTDCPSLSGEILRSAFRELDSHDLVIGPAADGGYYLLGLKRAVPGLFEDVPWGTGQVLRRTLAAAGPLDLSIGWLPPLTDVDRPADLPSWYAAAPPRPACGASDRLSVIIPALNEAPRIGPVIERALEGAREVIVVDGGSDDGTAEVAGQCGATVLTAPPGRALQMNAGSLVARYEILLFLHADTLLPSRYGDAVRGLLQRRGTAAGAFSFAIREPVPLRRLVELTTNLRSRGLQMPYGDQGLFLYHDRFRELGGFACLPILEDVDLVQRLCRQGRIRTASAHAATSGRRWEKLGFWRTTGINRLIMAGYRMGVSPHRLAALYGRRPGPSQPSSSLP